MKVYGLTLLLQDDPAKIAAYKQHHQAVWPEVTARIRQFGIREMQIFLLGRRMFMYIETEDSFDPKRDFARINEGARSLEWDNLMRELQERAPEAQPHEWWGEMEHVFDLNWPQHRA